MYFISRTEERAEKEAENKRVEVTLKSIMKATFSFMSPKHTISVEHEGLDIAGGNAVVEKLDEPENKTGWLTASFGESGKSFADMFACQEKQTRLHLEDEVNLFNNLSVTPANKASGITMHQMESLFTR